MKNVKEMFKIRKCFHIIIGKENTQSRIPGTNSKIDLRTISSPIQTLLVLTFKLQQRQPSHSSFFTYAKIIKLSKMDRKKKITAMEYLRKVRYLWRGKRRHNARNTIFCSWIGEVIMAQKQDDTEPNFEIAIVEHRNEASVFASFSVTIQPFGRRSLSAASGSSSISCHFKCRQCLCLLLSSVT